MTNSRPPLPNSRLVPHDITLTRTVHDKGRRGVRATVLCERRGRRLEVEECAECERFARIEPHEAGYVMMCRSTDSFVPQSGDTSDECEDEDGSAPSVSKEPPSGR